MRLEQVKRDVTSSGTMEVARATIKPTAKIFDMFANDTYADKPVAICRELVANGVDAHVMSGQPKLPVEVTMPTALDPVFKVRDFGTGMPHAFVMGPFMAYTDGSTKDKDDVAIGGFGIGSKSPFAYCDQFTLRVVHDGVLSVYTMFKDEGGIPAIGLQAQRTTDEKNGVEVSFPVEDKDQEAFRNAAQTALQYFQPLPVVKNGTLKAPEYSHEGNGWALRKDSGDLGVIMGGVRYPVSIDSLRGSLRTDAKLLPLLKYGIDLTLPLGSCSVATSREALSYNDKTSENIRKGLMAIVDDVVNTFKDMFDHFPTEWEAMKALGVELNGGHNSWNRTPRQQLIEAHAKYKGKSITTYMRPQDTTVTTAWKVEGRSHRYRNNGACPVPKWQEINEINVYPYQIGQVIIDDLPVNSKTKSVAKIREWVNDNGPQSKETLILRPKDSKTIADIKALLREPTDILLTSTLPEPQKSLVIGVRPKVRMFTYDGSANRWTGGRPSNLAPSNDKRGLKEVAYKDQPQKGIMVVLSKFSLPENFYKKMDTELVKFDELVFINQTDEAKIKDSFENFEKVFEKRLKAALKATKGLEERLAISNTDELRDLFYFIKHKVNIAPITLTAKQRATPFGQIVTMWETYVQKLTKEDLRMAPFVTPKLPANFNPSKILEDFQKEQPDAYLLMDMLDAGDAKQLDLFMRNL